MGKHVDTHVRQKLSFATKLWNTTKLNAFKLRQQYLYKKQELARVSKNPDLAKLFYNIRKNERIKQAYRQLRDLNKPSTSSGGLGYILVCNDDDSIRRIDDIDEMNQQLYERNRIHFSQAHSTPCTTPEVIRHIGTSGLTPEAQAILSGQIPSMTTNYLQMIYQELNQPCPTVPLEMTFEDMLQGFAKWREQTSTSPSGRHLGIYKGLVKAHLHQLRTAKETKLYETL